MTTQTSVTSANPASAPTPAPAAPAAPATSAPAPQAPPQAPAPTEASTLLGADPAAQAAPAPAPAAPFDLKAPEGLDTKVFDAYRTAAQKEGVKPEAAAKLLDAMQAQQRARIGELAADFLTAAQADPEIGGAKFDETKRVAAIGAQRLGITPAMREILNRTGLGNHPEFLRLFYRAGLALGEDTIVSTSAPGGAPQDVHPAKVLFA